MKSYVCYAMECYDEWESNDMVWDSNTMVWDLNAMLWYVVCCKLLELTVP